MVWKTKTVVAVCCPCVKRKWVCRWPRGHTPSEQGWVPDHRVPVVSHLTRPNSRESTGYFSSGHIIASVLEWNFHSRSLLIRMSEAREWKFLKLIMKSLSDSLGACFLINVIWQNLVENFFIVIHHLVVRFWKRKCMVLTLLELLEDSNCEKLCYYLSAQFWAFSSAGKSTLA